MKNIFYRLLLLPLLLVAWGAWAQAPAWTGAYGVPVTNTVNGTVVQGVATNASGDIYVTGSYSGSATFGSTTLNSSGGTDVYLAKWSGANNNWAWAVTGTGTADDIGYGVAINGNNVYITGTFTSGSLTIAGSTLTNGGGTDMFVAKFYDNGTTVTPRQARQVSTGGSDSGRGIAVNTTTGTVYVAGFITGSAGAVVTVAGSSLTLGGSGDILVVRYTDAGASASTSLADGGAVRGGGTSGDRADAIAVSSTGAIFVAGRIGSAAGTVSGTSLPAANGGSSTDAVLARYTDSGSGLVNGGAVSNGGSGSEQAYGVAADGTSIYLTGAFTSTSTTFGSSTLASDGVNYRMFLARYSDTGGTPLATGAVTSTGTTTDFGWAVAANSGTVYVGGTYTGAGTISGTSLPATGTNAQVFVAKYTDATVPAAAGALSGGSAGSAGTDAAYAIAMSGTQAVVGGITDPSATSTFGSYTIPAGPGGFLARVGLAPIAVTSIVPAAANPTNASSVTFTVTFAASVTGLTTANFTTANGGGVTGSSVTSLSGSGTTYTVTVNTGSGSGTLGLTLANDIGLNPGISNKPFTGTPLYTIDKVAPTVTISSTAGASGSTTPTTPIPFTVTFSESVTGFVASDLSVTGGTVSGFTGSGTTYTFNVTPTSSGTTVVVNVPANVAQDAATNGNTAASQFSITYQQPTTTVASVTGLTPSPTATAQVSYRVVFAASVNGVTTGNFTLNTTGISGASVSSVSGSGTTYTVVVNTGTGDGSLRLDVANSTNVTPTVTGLPYTSGTTYTITKSFAAAPTLLIQAAGSASGNSDVTAFVDVVQVLSGGSPVANALQNTSFETNNVAPSSYLYQSQGVVASPWSFGGTQAGISRNNSAFGSTAADGDAVTFLQSAAGNNGNVSQNLAVPTGSYQISFRTVQRNYTSKDQVLNVFVNNVFVGSIQPNNSVPPTYDTFTSASFNVIAPALTATISSTAGASGSTTNTSPIPFTVTFSQAATGFTASDLAVTNGTVSGFAGSGTTYTFNVTPTANGAVTVTVPANSAIDANNTGNTASSTYSIIYAQPVTAAPVVTAPANGSRVNTATPAYSGTAAANATITVYVDLTAIGTTTANGAGNWSLNQPTALAQGSHTVYATAQTSGSAVSVNSSTNTFIVDTVRPTVAISSSTAANGGSTGTSPIAFTVTFSEGVTGFVTGDITVTNGTISGFTGSGTTYTFNVTPTANGAVTVNVPANVAQDAAGNGNTAATQYAITYTQPVVATAQNVTVNLNANGTATLNASSVNNGSTGGGTLTYTIQKIVYGRVAEGQTLTLSTPNGANFTQIRFASYGTPIDNGNGNYQLGSCNAANSVTTAANSFVGRSTGSMDANNGATANNNPTLGDPCVGTPKALAVQAGYSADAASLTYACAEAAQTNYVLLTVTDGSGNTSTSVARVTVVAPPTASFTLSPTSGNVGAVITASGSNLSGATALTVNGATATISNLTATGFTFVVPAGATVGAGSVVLTTPCSQTPSTAFTVTQLATAAPVVISPANGSLTNNPTPPFTGTAVSGSTVTVYVDNLAIGTTTADASGNWTLTAVTALASGSHTVYATAQASGNSVSASSNTNTFTVDTVRPSVAISSTAGASGSTTATSPIPFTVTFSESVTGFVTGDLTVTNGTVSGFTGSGTTYTFNVTPTTPGTATTVNVPANVAQDAAGNGNTAAASAYSLTFTAPTITVGPATLPSGTQGTAYSQALTASGGSGTYTYAVTAGALPAGLSLTGNTISGTPTTNGTFNFTVTATDASAAPGPYGGSRAYTLIIAAPAVTAVTWTGAVSTDWFTAGNWTPTQAPDGTIDATIPSSPSGGRFPAIVTGAASTRNLTLNSGAILTQTGGTLSLTANLINNGTFQPTGGTVVLSTNALASSILGSSNTRFWNLTVSSNGAQLSTSATTSVQRLFTLNGNISTSGNPLILESDATGTALLVNNGGSAIFGNVTVQRYIAPDLNAGLGYRHYSAPVSTATVGSLATGSFTPVVNPAYNTSATPTAVTAFPTVYGYDQSRLATATNNLAAFDKGWFSPASLGDALTVGQGYTVNLAANQTLSVTGAPNNGNISLNLARNSGATAADAGWALVGNPYPAPLDYSLVAPADRVGLDAAIYVFESTSQYGGSYRANVNGVGGNANSPNAILAQGQGFFVRVSNGQTSGNLTLRNSQRLTAYANPVYHRTAETRPLVQLDLTSATGSDPVYVYFENGATTGVDREFDAVKLPNSHGLNVSAETGAQRLAIDALPALSTATVTVPLTVGVPAAGSYTFTAAQLLNLSTTPVYLRDLQTGAVVDLARQPSYHFVVSNAAALVAGRFELVFSPQATLATAPAALAAQVGVYPNPATTAAFVELPAALGRVAVAAELVDALGRTVRTQQLPAQGAAAHRLSLADLATGVYTLHLNTSAGVVVKKLVVQ